MSRIWLVKLKFGKLTKPLKGNALLITIVIALVLGIISSSLIMLVYYNRQSQSNEMINDKLDRNVQSGINLILADTLIDAENSIRNLDLFGNGDDSIMIQTYSWGIYRVGIVKAANANMKKSRSFVVGEILPDFLNSSIYLADHDRPLALVGKTSVIGDAYLPKAGVSPAYIDQRSYNQSTLIAGKVFISEKYLPSPEDQVLIDLNHWLIYSELGNSQDSLSIFKSDTLIRSFQDSALRIIIKGKLTIQNHQILGHVIIQSDSLIEIDQTSSLKNIIVAAPVVRIKSGFRGSIQVLASDSIIVEENCSLEYPSALILIKRPNQIFQPSIKISSGSRIEGVVYSYAKKDDLNKTRVDVEGGSLVEGLIFVNGFLALKGTILGSVAVDYFLYSGSASIYENYLVDVAINRVELSAFYIGPVLFKQKTRRGIISWVD